MFTLLQRGNVTNEYSSTAHNSHAKLLLAKAPSSLVVSEWHKVANPSHSIYRDCMSTEISSPASIDKARRLLGGPDSLRDLYTIVTESKNKLPQSLMSKKLDTQQTKRHYRLGQPT